MSFRLALLLSGLAIGVQACGDPSESESTGSTDEADVSSDATETASPSGAEETSVQDTAPSGTSNVDEGLYDTTAGVFDTAGPSDTTGPAEDDADTEGGTATDSGTADSEEDTAETTAGTTAQTDSGTVEDGATETTTDTGSETTGTDTGTPVDPSAMVLVPAGSFMMGCNSAEDANCISDENPYHTVTLASFLIDQTEVTVAEYAECVAAKACTEPATGPDNNWLIVGKELHPVNGVTWFDADKYCEFVGKRLPTEAEWEYAARGTDGRVFTWGSTAASCSLSNREVGCADGTTAIGLYPGGVGPYATLDMAGNVTEWVSDWYDSAYYSVSPASDPAGPATGTQKILRGGAWNFFPDLRVSSRASLAPDSGGPAIGFRCVQ